MSLDPSTLLNESRVVCITANSAADVADGSWLFQNAPPERAKGRETLNRTFFNAYAWIAAISGRMPMMFITRVRL
jgi:hypothetical protein